MFNYVFRKKRLKLLIGAVDLLGSIVFAPFGFLRKAAPVTDPENIVVLRLDQTGDCVQALPFFEHLKIKYPGAKVTAAVLEGNAFLFRENGDVDNVITPGSSWFVKGKNTGFDPVKKLSGEIKAGRYDLGFDLRGDIRNIALLYFSGVKRIIGYGCAGGGFMLDEEKPYDREMHEMDKNLRLIDEGPLAPPASVKFPESGQKEAEEFIRNSGAGKKLRVIMHPFAGTPSKRWGYKNYRKLADMILELNKEACVIIVGGPVDKGQWMEFERERVINAIGMNREASICIIRSGHVFIGSDSFPQYVAAYSGLKSCIIAGYTSNYDRWRPKTCPEKLAVFTKPVDCGPCELGVCSQPTHNCMDAISVGEVFNKIKGWI
jgi:ADP-heptose:LPS heptosyltransferase